MPPTAIASASREATLHANAANPHNGCPIHAAAAHASIPNGTLKVSAVPKCPLGRENRVDFIHRTWCFIEDRKLELITM